MASGKVSRRPGAVAAAAALMLALASITACVGDPARHHAHARGSRRPRACDVPKPILTRMRRGLSPGRSGDVIAVERRPNQFGTRHSSPYPYAQDVPLLLYGPGFVRAGVASDRPVTLADVAPTLAELLHFDRFSAHRDGHALRESLLPPSRRNGVPRLIVTVVWDGGGDDVLRQWPSAWPHLKALMARGTMFTRATAGSTPSITPAIHATIGTGDWPRTHGVTDTRMRVGGAMVDAWAGASPRLLRVRTLADMWDSAHHNRPLVGMLARDAWHLGMMGHGAFIRGGDRDIAALDDLGSTNFLSDNRYYALPPYLQDTDGLAQAVRSVDLRDGAVDARWLGDPLLAYDAQVRFTPAWSIYQTRRILQILRREGFGADRMPDLFFTNYKSTDLAGHFWNMVEPEVRYDLQEQDRQLGVLVRTLDHLVGGRNYVLALTADHGMTPYPQVTGGWSIEVRDMTDDITRAFDHTTPKSPLVLSNRGYQIFLDHREMRRNQVSARDVARFVGNYRLEDNVTPTNIVLPRFEDKLEERLFRVALTAHELRKGCRL